MGKFALLIGVSEYEPGLNPLPVAVQDVKAMQRVLQHPEMGGFAETDITVLENPQRQKMEEEIEKLFADRANDDLVLLYFSGHGITDDEGKLYLANSHTSLYENGTLIKARATAASDIHELMKNSLSQQQVIILDCCFSGAFAKDMKLKNLSIDIQTPLRELRAEGSAVLASCTSTQYSIAQAKAGSDLSVYTHYIVEGIETGAADTNNDGDISVLELHKYAKHKVQEAAPNMKPVIYTVREGFDIQLAKAALGDPKVEYRKEVEKYIQDGEISPIGRRILKLRQVVLGLSQETVTKIEKEALEPYNKYQQNLREYETALAEVIQPEGTLSQSTRKELKSLQEILGLIDEDTAQIEEKLTRKHQPPNVQKILTDTRPKPPVHKDDLSSEKGVNYQKLRDLLAAGKWEQADYETYFVMLQVLGKKEDDKFFDHKDLLDFPSTDLHTIDRLWVKYSEGHFGFSVQKKIYLSVSDKLEWKHNIKPCQKFGDRVGWKVSENGERITITRISNKDLPVCVYSIKCHFTVPVGHLPQFIYSFLPPFKYSYNSSVEKLRGESLESFREKYQLSYNNNEYLSIYHFSPLYSLFSRIH